MQDARALIETSSGAWEKYRTGLLYARRALLPHRLTAAGLSKAIFPALLLASSLAPAQEEADAPPEPSKTAPTSPKSGADGTAASARATYADLKITDATGNPIRTPREDWTGARERAKTKEWSKWVASRRAAVDDWMEKRHDHTGWVAGWSHNFVSPKDGSPLTFTPEEPGLMHPLSSPSDPKVLVSSTLHDSWVRYFRAKHADMMAEAAQLYRLTGDQKYATWAAEQLDFYADHLDGWPEHGKPPSRLMYQSLDEAGILIKWVQTARLLGNQASPERKAKWISKLFNPEAAMLQQGYLFAHNISCWHRAAAGMVALYSDDQALWNSVLNGPGGLKAILKKGATRDYLWFEQSFGYNAYVVRALGPFYREALLAGKGADLQEEMEITEDLMLTPLRLRFPNGQLPNPADGYRQPSIPSEAQLAGSAPLAPPTERSPDPVMLMTDIFPTSLGLQIHKVMHDQNWNDLLDPLPDPVPVKLPVVKSANLESSRMAVLKNDLWQVYFHYGQLVQSHSQAEALNFEVFYKDRDISHDPGTPGYGAALTDGYFRTGVGHNVALIDGLGPGAGTKSSWDPGKLVSFSNSKVVASQSNYRFGGSAVRSLSLQGERLVDRMEIATTDGKGHALGYILNLQGHAELPSSFHALPDFAKKVPKGSGFDYWESVSAFTGSDHFSLPVKYGKLMLNLDVKIPGDFTVYHGTVPDFVPDHREALYFEMKGEKAALEATFSVKSSSG